MPIYEYKCDSCGTVFELRQKFADDPLKVHEECGGAVHRLISAPALQFKGTGFYITDYAKGNGGAKPAGKSEGGDGSKSEGGSKGESSKGESSKGDSSKSESSKSESAKSDSSSSSKPAPAPASTTKSSSDK